MNTILLIRHGMTAGNKLGRYVGRTDEPLCPEGEAAARALFSRGLPACGAVFVSPYLRCRQTAAILFPGQAAAVVEDLRECDFGVFENRSAEEMRADGRYAAWVDSGCLDPIPGGESPPAFQERCCAAFQEAAGRLPEGETAAFVIHGGSIMAILSRFAAPRRQFYEWRVENCACVLCAYDGETLLVREGAAC